MRVLTTSRGRAIGVLLVIAAVMVTGLVAWTSRPRLDLTEARVERSQRTVPAGPGETGTVSLETVLYLPRRTPAPAVLVAHGFGADAASVDTTARELAARGFVVLAWSARGFGRSTGDITLDSPDHEVADASRLIDYLAGRPEVRQDRPGDPRVGVTGGSYGGALALLLAAYDPRVDAIAPAITWNNLGRALFPNAASPPSAAPPGTPAPGLPDPTNPGGADGVFKRAWAGILFSAGLDSGASDPAASTDPSAPAGDGSAGEARSDDTDSEADALPRPSDPAGPRPGSDPPTSCGRFAPAVCAASTRATRTGVLDPATAQLLWRSSPASVADRIRVPTLLVQGEADTLFGLDQADATARQIASAGGTVSVLWYSGGHDGGAPGSGIREQIAAWFDHYLGTPPGGVRAAEDALPSERGLRYAVSGGVRARRGTDTVRTVIAPEYPGLAATAPTTMRDLPLHGGEQDVVNPAGGYPASVTSLPGVGGTAGRLLSRITSGAELPGQTATFATEPLPEQLVLAGSPRVQLTVTRVPGQPFSDQAVLFGKLLDVAPDGRTVLIGGAVAPLRIAVPDSGARIAVTLPASVAAVPAGHRLAVTVSSTDQAYQGPTDPAVWRVGVVAAAPLQVPLIPGRAANANTIPTGPLVGIVLILMVGVLTVLAGVFRGSRSTAARAPADAAPLVVSALRKEYPGGVTAVNGISFTVGRNQVVGLLGPNGAGKTTALRMLIGLIHPSGGHVSLFGHRVTPGAPVLSRIGSFVEGAGLLPHLSGAENLRLYWAATGRPAQDARQDEVLEIAGLGTALHRPVRTYSQGMRQRLAIAQAMLGLPELLILDEPTNGLDPPQIHAMREVLRGYATDGRSVLVSSHLLAEVEQTCDHVIVMHRGAVVADGSVAELVAGGGQATFRVDDPRRAADILATLRGVSGIEVEGASVHAALNGTPRSDVVKHLVDAGLDVDSVGARRRLEDAFLALIGEDNTP